MRIPIDASGSVAGRFTDAIGHPPEACDTLRRGCVEHVVKLGKIASQAVPDLVLNLHGGDGARGHGRSAGDAARAVVVSLDGVMAPMKGGFREAGYCDGVVGRCRRGATAQRAHGPDAGVAQGDAEDDGGCEVEVVLAKRPDLTLVKRRRDERQLDVPRPRAA